MKGHIFFLVFCLPLLAMDPATQLTNRTRDAVYHGFGKEIINITIIVRRRCDMKTYWDSTLNSNIGLFNYFRQIPVDVTRDQLRQDHGPVIVKNLEYLTKNLSIFYYFGKITADENKSALESLLRTRQIMQGTIPLDDQFMRLGNFTKEEVYHGLGNEIKKVNDIIEMNFEQHQHDSINEQYWKNILAYNYTISNFFLESIPTHKDDNQRLQIDVDIQQLKDNGMIIAWPFRSLAKNASLLYSLGKLSADDNYTTLMSLFRFCHIIRQARDE